MNNYNPHNKLSLTAFVKYNSVTEAANTIVAFDKMIYQDRHLKVSFGTSKYCVHFLRTNKCPYINCKYIHKYAEDEDVIFEDLLVSKLFI